MALTVTSTWKPSSSGTSAVVRWIQNVRSPADTAATPSQLFAGARCCATRLGVTHDIIDIASIGRRLTGSALTDGEAVPDGHYAEDTMRLTVVPNRNAIMLTIAFGIAMARQAEAVAAAMHGGDHFIYPDCRPSFVDAFAAMQRSMGWRKLLSRRHFCAGARPT
jgi:Queuosine biosynthesis protein QueC